MMVHAGDNLRTCGANVGSVSVWNPPNEPEQAARPVL